MITDRKERQAHYVPKSSDLKDSSEEESSCQESENSEEESSSEVGKIPVVNRVKIQRKNPVE